MQRMKLAAILLVCTLALLALPQTAFARKQVYKAVLSPAAGATAKGSATLNSNPDGSLFVLVSVQFLSSNPAPTSVILQHGATPLGELCGTSASAAFGSCPDTTSFSLQGTVNPAVLAGWGVSGAQIQQYLNGEELYISVLTVNYPGGEARGQFLQP